jgi:hypothetical protein
MGHVDVGVTHNVYGEGRCKDWSHEESTSYTERYELLPNVTIAAFTAVYRGAQRLGSTR